MKEITKLKTNPKILIIPVIVALIVAAVFLSTQTGGSQDILSEAIEGGELTLTSVGRNYESLTQFVQNDDAQARQLLEGARAMLENGKAKLNSARRTSDEYVLDMLDNYQRLAEASGVMAQGVDNLLFISENLTDAIYYYSQKNYTVASEQASYCLEILAPLLRDFETSNATLNGINVLYIPSGQRDRLTLGVDQFRNETKIYNQYVLLLRSLLEGKDYLKKNAELEDLLRQLQSSIANKDYQTAETLRQRISEILQSLRDPSYQGAADLASQLDPSLLSGTTSDVAQELRNRLRNLEGIDNFENYLESLRRYLEALEQLQQGNVEGAEQAINEGLGILGQGQGSDSELQGLYAGLTEAFNTLQQSIRNPPPPG
jgi:F0F1-type ATP synthase membrane subunit b/b'